MTALVARLNVMRWAGELRRFLFERPEWLTALAASVYVEGSRKGDVQRTRWG